MMKKQLVMPLMVLIVLFAWGAESANATPLTLTLTPAFQSIVPGFSVVFVDLTVSGLNAAGISSIGAFSLDLLFDPTILYPYTGAPAGFGPFLGDFNLGEVIQGGSIAGGVFSVFQVSLLSEPQLAAMQGDSFRLATFGFTALTNGLATLTLSNIVISDGFGNSVAAQVQGIAQIQAVPEPATIVLLGTGLALALGIRRVRQHR